LLDISSFRLLFLFLTSRRPLTSPLFPYTTLFRSHRGLSRCLHRDRRRDSVRISRVLSLDRLASLRREMDQPCPPGRYVPSHGDGDRKSTRLNSSHVKISYAVFCLKKKNKKH